MTYSFINCCLILYNKNRECHTGINYKNSLH